MSQFEFPPLTASLDSEQVSGGALPTKQMMVGGYHAGGTKVYPLAVDADGQLQVDVVSSSPLPSGAATEAKQDTMITDLTNIETYTNTIQGAVSGTEMQVDVVASLPSGSNNIGDVDVLSVVPGVGATNLGKAIQSAQGTTDTGVPALVVRNDTCADLAGTDHDYAPLQVNNVGQLYTFTTLNTSTNSIGSITDISNSVVPGVGATNLGKAIQSAQGATDVGVAALVVRNDTLADLAGSDHDYAPLQVNATGALYTSLTAGTATIGNVDVNAIAPVDFLDAGVLNAASTAINTAGTVVVTSTLAAACTEIEVIDDIGEYMSIAHGTTKKAYLPLGGGRVKVSLATGDAIRLYSESGSNITSGKIAINFLG